ncbi:hypothetical protein [Burkholderia gladioli]|jgi:hypothetical protein|uniref:hypothetical protein n=1 Tax=Burkholderia gladioli TaxID=28095 RepID=UPI001641C77B|nr:hypothetical protein [Burkholderia gladioli]MDN7465806.1 hypothetical protein [Burkholderia gladioli]
MKIAKLTCVINLVAASFVLGGCDRVAQDKFSGHWVQVDKKGVLSDLRPKSLTLDIKNNGGNSYIVTTKIGASYVAQERDNQLVLNAPMSFVAAIDKSTGHLIIAGDEYERAK